jgi:hypothetical protein
MPLHPSRRARRALALIAALLLTLAASCGDDDGGGTSAPNDDAAADGEGAGGTSGSCDGTSATGSSPGNGSFSGTGAAAVSLEGGKAYTVHIGDFELSADDVSAFGTPTIPEGGTMFTVAVTVFNAEDVAALEPIAAGQVIDYTPEWGELTFVVTATDEGGTHGMSSNAEGTVTVTAVGDMFCGSVTYTDDQKSLSGTFEASVKAA